MLLTMCGVTMVLLHDLDFALALAEFRLSSDTAAVSATSLVVSTFVSDTPVLVLVAVLVSTSPSSTLASALASALAFAVPSPISALTETSDEDCGFCPSALADPVAAASAD